MSMMATHGPAAQGYARATALGFSGGGRCKRPLALLAGKSQCPAQYSYSPGAVTKDWNERTVGVVLPVRRESLQPPMLGPKTLTQREGRGCLEHPRPSLRPYLI